MAKPVRTFIDETFDEALVLLSGRHLRQVHASSVGAVDAWIHFFDAAVVGDVNLGTTVPKWVVFVPAGDATLAGAVTEVYDGQGIEFPLGIVTCAKTVGTTAGTTGPVVELIASILTD